MKTDLQAIILDRAQDAIVREGLEKALGGKPQRIKFGIDPTGPVLHIGRASTIRRLRNLQDLGHHIVLIIGDFTALIGDSSDKTAERQPLTAADIKRNMADYVQQLGTILDMKKVELHYNSEWLGKLGPAKFIELAQQFTVAQMIERENFSKRYQEHRPIGLHEFLYPILQGYDSVAVNADIEIGGSDQLFNLMAGRVIQRQYGQKPQHVMTFNLLEGTDGRKMSTSWGNAIYISDAPDDMYGKVMSVHDRLIEQYFRICTDVTAAEITNVVQQMKDGANPRDIKAWLAREIVTIYHGEAAAVEAEASWKAQFQEGKRPDNIPVVTLDQADWDVAQLLVYLELAGSKSEARRLVEQGGVRYNEVVVADAGQPLQLEGGGIIQVGKRRFVQLSVHGS